MKKTIINLLIAMVITFCGATSGAFSQIKEQSFERVKIPGIIQKDTVHQSQLKVFFEIDSVQHSSANGIKFSIKFKNTGTEIDSIFNFIPNGLRIHLYNSSKKDIFYRDRSAFGVYKPSTAFLIDGVKVNDKKADVILDNINVQPGDIVIPPKGSFELFCRMVKVLKDNPITPYTADQLKAIPPGIYQLYISFPVIHDSPKYDYKHGGIPVGYSAVLDSLTVNYGQY